MVLAERLSGLFEGITVGVSHPVLLGAFALLCADWYALTRDRDCAVRFFRALRRIPYAKPIEET